MRDNWIEGVIVLAPEVGEYEFVPADKNSNRFLLRDGIKVRTDNLPGFGPISGFVAIGPPDTIFNNVNQTMIPLKLIIAKKLSVEIP